MPEQGGVFLDEEAWRTTFEGWEIVDVAVRDRNIVYLALREAIPNDRASEMWEQDIPSRFVSLFLHKEDPAERWGHQGLSGFRKTRVGASREPIGQGLAVSSNGDVFASGSKKKGMEQIVPDGQPTAIQNVRTIGGRAYAVGLLREVYRRIDVGRWERLSQGLPPITPEQLEAEAVLDLGFRDIDGFAEDDLYAVGGRGDLWHHDGSTWTPCELPTNLPLFTVTCAGDGHVYLSGEGGTVLRGRGDVWQTVWTAEMTVPYNDTRWFDGLLWLCSDYRLDQLVAGQVRPAEHEGRRVLAYGHMDAAEGLLVVAGLDAVRAFDGQSWRLLLRAY